MGNTFKAEDKQKLIQLLNFFSQNAKITTDVQGCIALHQLLSWAQTELIPKIEANVLEVVAVRHPEPKASKGKDKA